MSHDLSPIRKFAYKCDRQQFGMIGTVTQRDPSFQEGRELEGQAFERATKAQGRGFSEHQGLDRSASDAGASCDRSWEAKILSPHFGNRCSHLRACAGMDLVGQVGLPHGRLLLIAPLLCLSLM